MWGVAIKLGDTRLQYRVSPCSVFVGIEIEFRQLVRFKNLQHFVHSLCQPAMLQLRSGQPANLALPGGLDGAGEMTGLEKQHHIADIFFRIPLLD